MEGVLYLGIGVALLLWYELSGSPDDDGGKPPVKQPPPDNGPPPDWQTDTKSYPTPMCGVARWPGSPSNVGISWAPEFGQFDTKEACLQGSEPFSLANKYLGSWRELHWDKAWMDPSSPGAAFFAPLVFDTGIPYDPSNPESGCLFPNAHTGALVASACPIRVPMGLPSTW